MKTEQMTITRNGITLPFVSSTDKKGRVVFYPDYADRLVTLSNLIYFCTEEMAFKWFKYVANNQFSILSRKCKRDFNKFKKHIETVGFTFRTELSNAKAMALMIAYLKEGRYEEAAKLAEDYPKKRK